MIPRVMVCRGLDYHRRKRLVSLHDGKRLRKTLTLGYRRPFLVTELLGFTDIHNGGIMASISDCGELKSLFLMKGCIHHHQNGFDVRYPMGLAEIHCEFYHFISF